MNKGPFVQGSSVDIYPVDSTGNPTGEDFPTITSDALGDFSVKLSYQGPVLLKGFGFYYDESAGALATSQLTLNALATVTTSGTQHAYINLVTHLTELREVALLGDGGPTLSSVISQAETELRAALAAAGLGFDPGAPGSQLNLLDGDNDQSAYIFALSSVFEKAGGGSAGLQTLLNTVQASLSSGGTLPATTITELSGAVQCVEPDGVTANLTAYIASLGLATPPATPNINRALDSDGDGIPNLTDTCLLVANPPSSEGGAQPMVNGLCSYAPQGVAVSYWKDTPIVLLGDVDSKHGPDLVLVDSVAGVVDSRLNDGSGNFGAAVSSSIAKPSGALTAALADMNADGKLDLVVNSDEAAYLPGDGSGHFGAAVSLFSVPTVPTGATFQVVSLNPTHDSLPDFVFFAASIGVAPQVAPASGPWPALTASAILPTEGGGPTGVWVGDWNGDGSPDILVSDASLGLLTYLGNGDGTFKPPTVSTTAGTNLQGIAGGDVDGDGHLDLIFTQGASSAVNGATGVVFIGYGDGAGSFAATAMVNLADNGTAACGLGYSGESLLPPIVADVTGDGTLDVYLAGGVNTVFDSNGTQMLGPSAQVIVGGSRTPILARPISLGNANPVGWPLPLVADVNADGTADVVLSGTSGLIVDLINLSTTHSW